VHIITYGVDLPPSAYYAIWETNNAEASDYIFQYLDFRIILIHLFILIISGILFIKLIKIKDISNPPFYARIILVLIILIASYFTKASEKNIPNKFINSYLKFKTELKSFKESIEYRQSRALKERGPIKCDENKPGIMVIVIGESASKYHQGLYGYQRNTNPLLSSIRNELFIFDSVIAPHSHTNPVISKVMTFADFDNMDYLYSKRNIIEYFKDAGYKTFWLSNQPFIEKFSTIASSIGTTADWYVFTNNQNDGDENELNSFDEVLFKPFEIALNDKSEYKFIVLHLMGSHSPKDRRYPSEFDIFKDWQGIPDKPYNSEWKKNVINAHDNSVLYNDSILYELIMKVKAKNKKSVFLYFSDHGEELYEYRDFWGHAEGNASIYMLDIPFILWLSDEYIITHADKVKNIKTYLTRKYQTDCVIHSIIDLAGCRSEEFDSSKSIFSPYFKYRKRFIRDCNYDSLINLGKKSITDK